MEREIPIKIIGQQDGKREKINLFKRDFPPLVTFTDDSSDDDESSEKSDGFSIEELESALFSDNEEDMPANISIIEPDPEEYDDKEDDIKEKFNKIGNEKFFESDDENKQNTDIKEEKNTRERVISIKLEDGTIISKEKQMKESQTEEKEFEPQVDERVIPIALASGEVFNPVFTTLEELKPPTWSRFHRTGNMKENNITIQTEKSSDVKVSASSNYKEPVDHNFNEDGKTTKSMGEQGNYEQEETKAEDNDVDNLWKEIKSLGSLPVNQKDETLKEVTNNFSNISPTNSVSKSQEHSVISIPILREEKAKDANKGDENENFLNKQVINLKIKETDIVTEKPAVKKQLKSSLKSGNKTQVPITIKIPIKHEKSSSDPNDVCEHVCQEDENGPVHSVSTQTDKNGCFLM